MPKKSPPIIINQVLRDISNIQDLIDEAHSLKKSVKKVDVDDKLELNEFVEGTKSIITRIQDEVSRINLYFGKFYDNWETSNNIVNENSVMNNLDQELHKEIINCEEPSLSKVGCQGVCTQKDTSSVSNFEDVNVCIQNDTSHTNVDVLVSVSVNIDNETSDTREISINETVENDANTKQHEINSQQIESGSKENEESNSILNNDIVEEAQNENQRNEENDQTLNKTDDTSPKDVVSNNELKDTSDNSDGQIANNAMDIERLDAETITTGGEFQENFSGNVNEIINSLDGIITQDIVNSDKLKENDLTNSTNKDTDASRAISKDNETGIPTMDTDDTTKDFDKSVLEDNIEKNNKNQLINDEGDINDNLDEDHTHKKNDSISNEIPLENTISDVENSKEISGDDEKVDSSKTDSDIVINEKTSKKHKKINGKRRSKNNVTSSDDDDKSKKNKKLNLNDDDDEIEKTKNNSVSNEIESDENTDSRVNEIKEENVWKIKCVDINKLIDPTIINEDSSVVVISDSDAEMAMVKKTKQSKKNPTNVSRSARPTRSTRQAKKVILLEDSDSTDCDIEKKIQSISSEYVSILRKSRNGSERNSSSKCKRSVRFTESYFKSSGEEDEASLRSISRRDRNKKTRDLVEVSSLSDNSSSSTDNDNDGAKAKKRNHKKKKNRNEALLELSLINAQEDKKFSWKTEVPLPIIPAQKLKENYEKKVLKSQIKRLTNMDTLKRSRSKTSELQSSSDSTTEVATKRTKNENPQKKDSKESESKSSDSEMKNSESEAKNSTSEPEASIVSANNDALNEKNDEVTKAILSGLKSGSDSSTNTSDDDQPSDKKADADKEKKNKENSKKEISDKENDQVKDSNSESDKEKKKWRKDKLLTEKISESDSDENFEKFTKKKNKLEEMASDTEDITPKKIIKRNKRRRIKIVGSDSDDSSYGKKSNSSSDKDSSSSSDSDEENEEDDDKTKKPARRRVKRLKDSSDDDDDKSTRKNIRKVWKKDSLAETTIQAEKEEQERKARIAEKQKKYNQIFEPDCLEKTTVDRVVLDFNEETKEELLKVDDEIVKHLKPHQVKGIQFMWDACFESIERTKSTTGSGCILAHCMGLGKTLQVITLSHTLLMNEEKTDISKVLVVAPLSTVLNWVAEFKKWLPNDDVVEVFELVSYKQNYERQYQVQEWSRCGGVLIMGYDMFRNLTNPNNKRMSKKMRTTFHSSLVDPGPDLVICDEGHLLKNEKSSISVAMNRLRTMRRIVLTGTPLQNNLKEYFCMVQFVKPSLLGTYKEYLNRFVNPITNGQYTDSTPHDIQIMRKRSHVLHKLLDGVVQRKDYSVLAPYLPPKYEYVLFVSLTEIQIKLYEFYLKEKAKQPQMNKRSSFLFIDFQELQRICTHPRVLLNRSIKAKLERDKRDYDEESEGSLKDFIDDGDEKTTSDSSTGSSKSGSDSDENADSTKTKPRRVTRATASIVLSEEEEPEAEPHESEWFSTFCKEEDFDNIAHSGKLSLLFDILRQAESIGDKVLVFSQSLYSLSIIEYFLSKIDEATQNGDVDGFCGFSGSWSLGLDYFRLDGSSSCDNRAAWCKSFNNPDNIRARLFLISTRAGGLGINLVAANRVIIFDVSWNPSHDTQSIYRVYRFGQNKPSFIYRFVTMGTMEMKVYERQVIKQSISKRVIDEQQIDRHYNQNDLAELYKFDPHPEERPIPLVPKDVLLGELLQQDAKIYKYHEHQSLLENKVDEVLDEAERKAAWEEFENEKKARQYSGTINNTSTQLIVKALASIVQKDNPEWDPATVQNMVPSLLTQLEEQIALGDMSMYTRVMAEIRLMQTAEQQKFQEYYRLQHQALLMRQYQQQLLNNPNASQFFQQWNQYRQPLRGNMGRVHNPGPSASSTRNLIPNNPNEVIDLND